jgi:hypothetical protein
MIDPAFDMPRNNWLPQGSFEAGELALVQGPDEGTLICLPPINQDWLPYIMGCLDQLRNPSTWIVVDDDAMEAILTKVARLQQMFGGRAPCFMYAQRFTADCLLQYSTDGGTTWTTVDGWAENYPACNPPQTILQLDDSCDLQESFDNGESWTTILGWHERFTGCVQAAAPIIGLPPNPQDQTPDQLSCSISDYLANEIILDAMGAAVTAIQDDLTLLTFGANILTLIPEFVIVALGYDAIAAIYGSVEEGTLSDYEAALTDASLWGKVRCAIYDAIVGDGYVTPDNFAEILTRIAAISYTYSDVITAIHGYVEKLGATGLAQLSQGAGLNSGADCSSCAGAGWCYVWDFTVSTDTWESYNPAEPAAWVPGTGWTGIYSPGSSPPAVQTDIKIVGTFNGVTSVEVFYTTNEVGGGAVREIYAVPTSGPEITGPLGSGIYTSPNATLLPINADCTEIGIILRSAGSTDNPVITKCAIRGAGTNPFGTSNCL